VSVDAGVDEFAAVHVANDVGVAVK